LLVVLQLLLKLLLLVLLLLLLLLGCHHGRSHRSDNFDRSDGTVFIDQLQLNLCKECARC
jgi:competence protein ComGF